MLDRLVVYSENFQNALYWFEHLKKYHFQIDEISYSRLINKATDFGTAKPFYEEFLVKFPFQKGNF